MEKIKVCMVITRLVRGGAAKVALTQGELLQKKGYQVSIATGPQDSEGDTLISEARQSGLNVVVIPTLLRDVNPSEDIKAFFGLISFFRKEKFQIVHTHTSKAGILGRWAAKIARIPIIVHAPHGHIYAKGAQIPGVAGKPFRKRVYWHVEKFTNSITDRVITLTNRNAKAQFRLGLGPKTKFLPVHNGVDTSVFAGAKTKRAEIRQNLQIPHDAIVCGSVGRLTEEKGHEVFINAAKILTKTRGNLVFIIAGDGPLRPILEQKAQNLGIGGVKFLGSRADIPEILSAFDIFVLPSYYEGFGIAALEAMASGLPVVATRTGGVPEVVTYKKTGILVEPGNPEELARAIDILLQNPRTAKQYAEEGEKRVNLLFTNQIMADKLDVLYRKLLNKRGLL